MHSEVKSMDLTVNNNMVNDLFPCATVTVRRNVNSIDFSHSSCKAWSTINKLTGRFGNSSHLCPTLANSTASQLVKNGAHKIRCRKSTRLINKVLSDLWNVPTSEGYTIFGFFIPGELAAALNHLQPRKSPGLDYIFQSLYPMPGQLSNLSYMSSSLPACANSRSQDLEKSTNNCIP